MFQDNADKQRFEWTEKGLTAFSDYRQRDGRVLLTHVEAPVELRGTGAAGRLMQATVDHARQAAIKLEPRCSYAVAWFKRHREASDVLA